MADAKIIKRNGSSETIKHFAGGSAPYEHLRPGDEVEVEEADGSIAEYYVTDMKWDFTHFGDTIVVTIQPVKPPQRIVDLFDNGKMYRIITGSMDP